MYGNQSFPVQEKPMSCEKIAAEGTERLEAEITRNE